MKFRSSLTACRRSFWGQGTFEPLPLTHERMLSDSAFGGYTRWQKAWAEVWSVPQVVGFLHSASFASERLLGERLTEFDEALAGALLHAFPDGQVPYLRVASALLSIK